MIEKMTIGTYAKKVGSPRDTIYKRLISKKKPKLKGVNKIEIVAGIKILHVNLKKLSLVK